MDDKQGLSFVQRNRTLNVKMCNSSTVNIHWAGIRGQTKIESKGERKTLQLMVM